MRVRSCFVAALPLFLFAAARAGVAAPVATASNIADALAAPDGSAVSLQTVLVDKAARGYIVVRAPWSADERVAVVAAVNVKRWQPVAVKGTLTTLVNGSRAIRADEVLVYTDAEGAPVICPIPPPMTKGAIAASFSTAAAAIKLDELAMLAEDETPPVPDPTPPAVEPQYVVGTISEALALDEGSTVRINGKPIASTGDDPTYGAYFVAGEDGSSETLKTFSSATASTEMRAAGLTGTIAIQAGVGKVLSTDTGPGNPPEGFHGLAQLAVAVDVFGAKTKPDDMEVQLVGKVVSRAFPSEDVFYIQEPDRACGIKVLDSADAAAVAPGDLVGVTGIMKTDAAGERYVEASATDVTGSTDPPVPLTMVNRSVGGAGRFDNAGTGAGQIGAVNATGLNNIGLLVRTAGRVTEVGAGYFCIDDGSPAEGVGQPRRIRVDNPTGHTPAVGDFASVTGVSSLTDQGTTEPPARLLKLEKVSDLHSICPPNPPENLTVVSTGSGKITLYWDEVEEAQGYNIYRGLSSGGENYASPVNGGTPVSTPSYPGSKVYAFTETGLTDETEYFYTVKAIAGCGASQPSNEDSDVADPAGIPWDGTNPADVLQAVRAAYADDPPEGLLRVAGPDGRIYEDGQTTVLPPDGEWIAGTNQIRLSDGTQMSLPETPESPGESLMSGGGLGPLKPATTLPQHLGPYRRVRTTASYTGARGSFYLPVAGDANKASVEDDIYILLGSSGTGEVDAGLQWSQSLQGQKNGWNPYMLTYPRQKPIINVPTSPRFTFDQFVELTYRPRTTYPRHSKAVSLITVLSDDQSLTRNYGAYSVYTPNEPVRMKRMHSIAQGRRGYRRTDSYIQGVAWRSGEVRTIAGTWTSWTDSITNENGSNPAKGAVVNWFETSPYIAEDNIKIDLR